MCSGIAIPLAKSSADDNAAFLLAKMRFFDRMFGAPEQTAELARLELEVLRIYFILLLLFMP